VTIGALTAARFAILPEENLHPFTIQERQTAPLEIAFRAMQKNPCAASKMTIVL
jgi:hypothetical protein